MAQITRVILKSLSWRIISTVITLAVAWLVTGSPSTAGVIAAITTVVSFFGYIVHELWWEKRHPFSDVVREP